MSKENTNQFPNGDILVVEDNTSDLKLLSVILTEAGYRMRPASDGELALRSVQAKLPDLILLDIQMPGMSGVEVCRRLKADPATMDIPVIFCSVYVETDLKVEALEAGGIDFISKPYAPAEVLARINIHLKMYRCQRRLALQSEELITEIEERKQAEEAHRENEQELNAIFNGARDGIALLDITGKILRINKYIVEIGGFTEEELIGKRFTALKMFPLKSMSKMITIFSKIIKGQDITYEVEVSTKKGEKKIIQVSNSFLKKEEKVVGIVAILRDITEHKRAEEELRLHSEITENIVEGVYLIGFEDVIIKYTNPKFEEIFGYGPGEMHGKHASIVNAPTDKDPTETAKEFMDIIYKTGEWHGEVNNIKKDGTTFWCYANVSVFDHPKFGKVIVAIHTDITERKQAEEVLRESEEKYRLISDNTNDFIALTSLDRKYIYVSPSFNQLGYEPDDLIGTDSFELVHPDDKKRFLPILKQVISGVLKSDVTKRVELRLRDKSGEYHPIESTANLITDQSGKLVLLSVFRDITERKQVELEIRQKTDDLTLVHLLEQASNRGESLRKIFQILSSKTEKMFHAFGSTVYLLDDNNQYLEMQNLSIPRSLQSKIEILIGRPIPSIRIPAKGSNIFGKCLETQKSIVVTDKEELLDVLKLFTPNIAKPGTKTERAVIRLLPKILDLLKIQCMICVPLKFKDIQLGIINISCRNQDILSSVGRMEFIAQEVSGIIYQKILSKKIKESENQYREVVESSRLAIIEDDAEGNILFYNERFLEMFDLNKDEVLNITVFDLIHPEDRDRLYQYHVDRIHGGEAPGRYEFRGVRKDGSIINLEVDTTDVVSDVKEARTRSFIWDISARKAMERELSENEKTLRNIFENSTNLFYSHTPDHQLTYLSP